MALTLDGRAAVITGASQGLGLAIARAYVREGASVFLCARGADLLERARIELAATARPGQKVLARAVDVADAAQAAEAIAAAVDALPELDVLVNNAGVQGPMGVLEETDWDAWVETIMINLVGSVACCRAVVPHLKRRGGGRILQLSGGGATQPMPRMSAYAASKAAIVRFVETLAHELRADRVTVNAIAPGALNTRMLDEVIAAGPSLIGPERYARALAQKTDGGASLERAAQLAVFLASSASEGITGRLISAVWDPWETLGSHAADIDGTDVYTLRRIVPADRGFDWGDR